MKRTRVLILGAAGRDFHNFNVVYRRDVRHEVVAFTAQQIPHIAAGSIVYAGVDYQEILRAAEAEADVLVGDGGNNDTSFLKADVYLTVVDPHRPGDALRRRRERACGGGPRRHPHRSGQAHPDSRALHASTIRAGGAGHANASAAARRAASRGGIGQQKPSSKEAIMIGSILVGSDGTPASEGALRLATELAERRGASMHVISVLEPLPVYPPGGPYPSLASPLAVGAPYSAPGADPELDRERTERLFEQVRAQVREIAGEGPYRSVAVEIGSPAPTLVRAAGTHGADLIVLGVGEHHLADRWFGTETALRVMNLAHMPVLAVRPEATGLPRRAVIAADFSEFSKDAARATLELLGEGAEAHLVHVTWAPLEEADPRSSKAWIEAYTREVQEVQEMLRSELAAGGRVEVHGQLLKGSPADALLGYAKQVNADLIAAGSHGYGFFARVLMGSVSTRLVRGAHCSVLVTPPRTESAELQSADASRRREHQPMPPPGDLPG